jgi:hypothetical protein
MSECPVFQDSGSFSCYRPVADISIQEGIGLVLEAMRCARERGISTLLIDVTQLTGFEPPDFWQRVRLSVGCAEEAQSRVIVAIVAAAEMIDPEKIGVHIARNRGALIDVFTNEQDAREWLANPN